MRQFVVVLFLVLAAGSFQARAQAVPAATAQHLTITAGGMVSVFQTGYDGDWSSQYPYYPLAHSSTYPLIGAGAYADLKFTRWVQIEGEARWMRFNQYANIYQDNYLIGPRVPIHRFGKADIYGKALVGFSNMNFDPGNDHGRFTTVAFGGGVDYKLTRRLTFRAIDAEYQYWPTWGNSSLSPYGASMGIGYRVF